MTRFEARTTPALDRELEELSRLLGLRSDQRGELLRDLTALAAWVVRQEAAGKVVEARGEDGVVALEHPVLLRSCLGPVQEGPSPQRMALDDEETRRLASILDSGFDPTPALQAVLERLAGPQRVPPELTWNPREG